MVWSTDGMPSCRQRLNWPGKSGAGSPSGSRRPRRRAGRRRLAAVPSPLRSATWSTVRSVVSSRDRARRTRWPVSHWCGVVPVAPAEVAAKVRGDCAARSASSSTDSGWSRLSTAQAMTWPIACSAVGGVGAGGDVLGLSAVPMGRHDHATGHAVGDVGPVVQADEVQRQVDAGRGTGRREHAVVLHPEHVVLGVDPGEPFPEGLEVHPVGRGPTPVQDPGLGQGEGARAERHHPRPAVVRRCQGLRGPGPGVSSGRRRKIGWVSASEPWGTSARSPCRPSARTSRPARDLQVEPEPRGHRAPGRLGTNPEVVPLVDARGAITSPRAIPKTSQATANSKGLIQSMASSATTCAISRSLLKSSYRLAGSLRALSILPLVGLVVNRDSGGIAGTTMQ